MMINGVHYENISCQRCCHRHPAHIKCWEAAYWANLAREEACRKTRPMPQSPSYVVARATLVEYLKMKTDEGDWRGVSEAANDLRVLEARNENVG